jgi:hypothetical protein
LPATWRSELVPVPTHGAPPSFDALVRITAPDGREALFAAEAKVIVNPRDVAAALWRVRRAVEETPALDAGRTVPLIVARYLNPRAREMLESEGASYADATGNLLCPRRRRRCSCARRGRSRILGELPIAPSGPSRAPRRRR